MTAAAFLLDHLGHVALSLLLLFSAAGIVAGLAERGGKESS